MATRAAAKPEPEQPDYEEIAEALKAGDVVPFLGAGASMSANLPSATVLAEQLAKVGRFPDAERRTDLAFVASYLVQVKNSLKLARTVRKLFQVEADPGRLHRCLASIDELQLIVTTNYDDLVERAFEEHQRQPWVVVDPGTPGNVWFRSLQGQWDEVDAEELRKLIDPSQPIVFKMHGNIDRNNKKYDWFLITEEHYVDFLGRPEATRIPSMLAGIMRDSNLLFLGYGLKDWNVRVMLRKLAQARHPAQKIDSWAVVRNASEAEKKLWEAHNIKIYEVELDDFLDGLEAAL